MPNPSRPDDDRSNAAGFEPSTIDNGAGTDPGKSDTDPGDDEQVPDADQQTVPRYRAAPPTAEPATEVIAEARPESGHETPQRGERRFTAPGFDANETAVIDTAREPATEAFRPRQASTGPKPAPPRTAKPQLIPPRLGAKLRTSTPQSWGWVLALILVILALAAIAVLGTVVLTHGNKKRAGSSEDQVRNTIGSFDVAVQNGDLTTLRGITCGDIRDGYVNYDEDSWADTYRRVAAARQYPVVASIDQVVVNDGHAEANVTAFMASAPQVRSTRSFDLQYRDNQWKICQSTSG
jgi:hypothetical protein